MLLFFYTRLIDDLVSQGYIVAGIIPTYYTHYNVFTDGRISDTFISTHNVFRPKDLSVFGRRNKLPLIVWGNGSGANSPWEHVNFLSEVSSHGFLIIAIGPIPKEGERGGGRSESSQLTDAINWAIDQNNDRSSLYYNRIDITKITVSGMSCGGLLALEIAPDPVLQLRLSAIVVFWVIPEAECQGCQTLQRIILSSCTLP
jgi:hypothetical protein